IRFVIGWNDSERTYMNEIRSLPVRYRRQSLVSHEEFDRVVEEWPKVDLYRSFQVIPCEDLIRMSGEMALQGDGCFLWIRCAAWEKQHLRLPNHLDPNAVGLYECRKSFSEYL
ncbi:MAG: hypothetical protein ACKVHP_07925, partial [Verrucomicrobiales bacterium]